MDRDAAQGFLRNLSYVTYLAEVEGFLAGPPEVVRAKVIWSKG